VNRSREKEGQGSFTIAPSRGLVPCDTKRTQQSINNDRSKAASDDGEKKRGCDGVFHRLDQSRPCIRIYLAAYDDIVLRGPMSDLRKRDLSPT
jgi:hypothetical protein